MGRKLRVFVSSTMEDLANERAEVVSMLRSFNCEPVNAEQLGPTGERSWERLLREIETCDLFVLLLGERYGWIPKTGPKAHENQSVTELEYREAKRLEIPVLPFIKKLPFGAKSRTRDAKRRDAFQRQVKDWTQGEFIAYFELARELAEKVKDAFLNVLFEHFLSPEIHGRAEEARHAYEQRQPAQGTPRPVNLPSELVRAVKQEKAVLLAGSGFSLSAGYPSALAFTAYLAREVRKSIPDYFEDPPAEMVERVATDLETVLGRSVLVDRVHALMQPPQGVVPTQAHQLALKLFDKILTTNMDPLFEEACRLQGKDHKLLVDRVPRNLSERWIAKLYGSMDAPESLVLTDEDDYGLEASRPQLWKLATRELEDRQVIVVGSSLRHAAVIRLLSTARYRKGYYVLPSFRGPDRLRAQRFNLEPIEADADGFMSALARNMGGRRSGR